MLIHLTPKLNAGRLPGMVNAIHLVDIECKELDLHLKGGRDIVARRPYPNKSWFVACRKRGRKAVNGILIETESPVREFTTVTRWAIAAEMVVAHRVRYVVLDQELDATSSDVLLWGDRRPRDYPVKGSPLQVEPCMELVPGIERVGDVTDTLSNHSCPLGPGTILDRSEVFHLPTIEDQRLEPGVPCYPFSSRLPELSDAFRVAI